MKTTTFAITALALVAAAFAAGYVLGPIRYRGELERAHAAEEQAHQRLWGARRAKAEHSFQLVRYLDEGSPDKTRDWLNLMVDSWISETAAHSRPRPWITPDMQPSSDTAFLARVARHREQHPVTYDDPEHAEWMSNILSTAVQIERQRDGNTEPEN
jgi:hypothetical protein